MNLLFIKRGFKSMSDAKFLEFGNGVIAGMTGNNYFPDHKDKLKPFKTKFFDYRDSIPPKEIRNQLTTTIKNRKKVLAVIELIRLSFYVEYEANFNQEAIESAGFQLKNKPRAKGLVGQVKNLRFKTTGDGVLIVQCAKDSEAAEYEVRVTKEDSNWDKTVSRPNRTVRIPGLPTNTKLIVQMRLKNSSGESHWSSQREVIIPGSDTAISIHK